MNKELLENHTSRIQLQHLQNLQLLKEPSPRDLQNYNRPREVAVKLQPLAIVSLLPTLNLSNR